MISSQTEIRVRYAETDMMGIAHHGNYMAWFEQARVHMMDEIGYPYREMEKDGFRLPVLEVWVRYRRPVTFDDRVTIEAAMKEKDGLRMRIDYTLHCGGEITGEAYTCHAFINKEGQPARPPQRFRDLMARHFG